MIDTLIGVLVGGIITTASTLLVQSRTARMAARSEIYIGLISRARVQPAEGGSSQSALDAVHDIRRRAVLLRRDEAHAAIAAEKILAEVHAIIADERATGHPKTAEYKSLLQQYNEQINDLERLISRRLRWPS
jgi:gas vesicle protein